MSRLLKRVHILGTLWFLVCAATLLAISLRQAGLSWWVVFSVSGYSAILFVFFAVIYAFALFRGVVRAQCAVEHPLSTSSAYLFFYDAAPFLGTLAGVLGCMGVANKWLALRMAAEGAVGMTFLVWVVIDTAVGFAESLLPSSRKARAERLAAAREARMRRQKQNADLLQTVLRRQEQLQRDWRGQFDAPSKQLAQLLSGALLTAQAKALAIDLGAKAWQAGRIPCMRFVQQLIGNHLTELGADKRLVQLVAAWWDGIGSWRQNGIYAAATKIAV